MEPGPPLNGEFMGESSPRFEWEIDSMQKLEAWDAWGGAVEPASETSAEVTEITHG